MFEFGTLEVGFGSRKLELSSLAQMGAGRTSVSLLALNNQLNSANISEPSLPQTFPIKRMFFSFTT